MADIVELDRFGEYIEVIEAFIKGI